MQDTVAPYFQEKWDIGAENEMRMTGESWADEDKTTIKAQGRIPYSFSIAASYTQRILATQRQSRQGWKTSPISDPNDEIKAIIGGILLRDYERKFDMPEIESEVYEDGTAYSYGVDKLIVENGEIKNKKLDYRNFVWDINSQRRDLEDASFVCEIERVPRYTLPEEYAIANDGSLASRDYLNYYVKVSPNGRENDLVSVFHHWQKKKKKFYAVYFADTKELADNPTTKRLFKKKSEAEQYVSNMEFLYATYGENFDGEAEIKQEEIYVWDYYKYTFAGIMEQKEYDWLYHPYNVFFSIRVKNDWTTLFDFMKSPQMFLDRIMSQIDASLRQELKQITEIDTSRLAAGETAESAQRKASKTGGVVLKNGSNPVITQHNGSGVSPQYLQLSSIMTDFASEMVGGKNMLGYQESASESGRAVALRQQQGKLIAYLLLSNLQYYKKRKGKKLLYLISKYDTAERFIKVVGGGMSEDIRKALTQQGVYRDSQFSKDLGFVRVNFHPITSLKDADLEVDVETAPLSESEKAFKLSQMMEAEKQNPLLAQSMAFQMTKLKYMDIEPSTREEVIQEIRAMQQQQQQQAQEAQNYQRALEQQKANIEKAKVLSGV